MAKQKTINREFKTVFFDYDGTMFDPQELTSTWPDRKLCAVFLLSGYRPERSISNI